MHWDVDAAVVLFKVLASSVLSSCCHAATRKPGSTRGRDGFLLAGARSLPATGMAVCRHMRVPRGGGCGILCKSKPEKGAQRVVLMPPVDVASGAFEVAGFIRNQAKRTRATEPAHGARWWWLRARGRTERHPRAVAASSLRCPIAYHNPQRKGVVTNFALNTACVAFPILNAGDPLWSCWERGRAPGSFSARAS